MVRLNSTCSHTQTYVANTTFNIHMQGQALWKFMVIAIADAATTG